MPTYSKDIVDQIIAQDGYYSGDSRAVQVSSYTDQGGKTAYHVSYSIEELVRFLTSPFVFDIEPLWVDGSKARRIK